MASHFHCNLHAEKQVGSISIFQANVEMAPNCFNGRVRFRCDNRREYILREIKEYSENKDIILEDTIRYTPEQNGERTNLTIIELPSPQK